MNIIPKTETITVEQLANLLQTIKGATPIAFSSLTSPAQRKTGNPFGEIRKLSVVQAMTGADYENSVNRQLAREGKDQLTFTAKERSWGKRIAPALVAKDDDSAFYLPAHILRTKKPVYLVRSPRGPLVTIEKARIEPFLSPSKSSAEAQGVEREIVYRNYSLTNIVSLSYNGTRYRVRRPINAQV